MNEDTYKAFLALIAFANEVEDPRGYLHIDMLSNEMKLIKKYLVAHQPNHN